MTNLVVERPKVGGVPPVHPATEAAWTESGNGLSPKAFSGLFLALSGLRNLRALAAVLGGSITGVLLDRFLSTFGGHSGPFLSVLGVLAFCIASATGVNAAGVLLMAQAKQLPPPGLQAALLFGLKCVPRLIAAWGALALLALVVLAAMALGYFVCRLPLVGPLLLVVVFPVTVVVTGVCLSGLAVGLVLVLPSVWEGATLAVAMARVLAIARSHLVESLLLLAAVSLLTLAVGCVVIGVVWAGLVPMLAVSSRVAGDGTLPALSENLRAYAGVALGGQGAVDGSVTAVVMGAGVLGSTAGALISTVWLLGLNLVYLRLAEGLGRGSTGRAPAAVAVGRDAIREAWPPAERRTAVVPEAGFVAESETALRRTSGDAAAPRVPRHAFAAAFATSPASGPSIIDLDCDDDATVAAAAASKCSHCFSPIQCDDVFCGICGYKLC